MPREITHWHVMTLAAKELRGAGLPLLADACEARPELALLGSIAHDAPYYYRQGNDPFEAVADALHGTNGEDTLLPMRALVTAARNYSAEERNILAPFLFGMLGHIGADTQFHPLIFYSTGNYHDPDPAERVTAQGRHRLFETYLDSWVRTRCTFRHGWTIQKLLAVAAPHRAVIESLLESTLTPLRFLGIESQQSLQPTPQLWHEGFNAISRYQGYFLSEYFGALARLSTLVLCSLGGNQNIKSLDALFSFARFRPMPFFDTPLRYKNPITGAEEESTTAMLLQRSVEETLRPAATLEQLLRGDTEAEPFAGLVGNSLNFGLPHAAASHAHHFSPEGVPLPGLSLPNRSIPR